MSTSTLEATAPAVSLSPASPVGSNPATGSDATVARGWLVGPWFDLLLIANVAWPLLLLAQLREGFDGRAGVQFWQLYFVTTPHRWITLFIVFLDRDRFESRRRTFLTVAVVAVVVCLGVRITTGTLTCLLAIDYLWNGWHFAAQHHGIYRIYDRRSNPAVGTGASVEKWMMRVFLMYVILRIAGTTWSNPLVEQTLSAVDWVMLAIPVWLIFKNMMRWRGGQGRFVYVTSLMTLYLSLLGAVHSGSPRLVLTLATAAALFHAIEYLSIVAWSVRQRHAKHSDRMGLLSYLAPRWGIAMAVFVVVIGAGGWLIDQHWMETWLLVNVIAAFLHYTYDGLIWRKPAAAAKA